MTVFGEREWVAAIIQWEERGGGWRAWNGSVPGEFCNNGCKCFSLIWADNHIAESPTFTTGEKVVDEF